MTTPNVNSSNNYGLSAHNTAISNQSNVQVTAPNRMDIKKIAGIALLAIAVILFVGALIATFGAAAGFLPLGIPIMQSFITSAPPVLIAALYLMQDGPAKIGLSANGMTYDVDDVNLKK